MEIATVEKNVSKRSGMVRADCCENIINRAVFSGLTTEELEASLSLYESYSSPHRKQGVSAWQKILETQLI